MEENTNSFCCKKMRYAIVQVKVIEYDGIFREYLINVSDNEAMQLILCPWCGYELGVNLNTEFFAALRNEYNLKTEDINLDTFANIPEEFKTDEWWRKRGL